VAVLEELKRMPGGPFRVASVLPLQPAYAYGQGLETADGWSNLYPAAYRELWLRILHPLFQNLPANRKIFDPDEGRPQDHYVFLGADLTVPGVGRLTDEDPQRAIKEGFDLQKRFNLDLLRLLNVRYVLSEYPLKAPQLELIHAPSHAPESPRPRDWATGYFNPLPPAPQRRHGLHVLRPLADYRDALRRMREGKDLFVYQLVGWLPRFRLVEAVAVEANGTEVLARLEASDGRRTAVLRRDDARVLEGRSSFMPGIVTLVAYHPDWIVLDVQTVGPGFLLIANTYNPNWRADVDGRSRTLLRANHAQFGLPIYPGDKRVTLQYAPPYSPRMILDAILGRHPDLR